MKLDWKTLSDKVDGMSPRQRGLIFAVAASIVVALVSSLLIEPQLAKQKVLSRKTEQQQSEIKSIQAQLQAMAEVRKIDPDAANRAELESLRLQLVQLKASLQVKQQHLIPPDKIAGLLEEILSRNRQLQLISLRNLPASAVTGEEEQAAAVEKEFFKHGIEMTVSGSYFDLLDYMVQLEKLPWQMFWGKASLVVETYPVSRMTLTLYTLSLDKAWLVI
ncbi:MAG TPA: MSHA biogenesis protein MshJ [Burkholderiales bacterium]|nr:MSHA biogenesis protein MshJ [Burkholderiales bacterium]